MGTTVASGLTRPGTPGSQLNIGTPSRKGRGVPESLVRPALGLLTLPLFPPPGVTAETGSSHHHDHHDDGPGQSRGCSIVRAEDRLELASRRNLNRT
eukprot:2210320-Rhodomonas_salina.2